MPEDRRADDERAKRGPARRREQAPATVPTAMTDVKHPVPAASAWNTPTAMVEMKIGKFMPNVPIRNSMSEDRHEVRAATRRSAAPRRSFPGAGPACAMRVEFPRRSRQSEASTAQERGRR